MRAYDAKGNLLGSSTDLQTTCYVEPYGKKVVYGTRHEEAADCEPVSPLALNVTTDQYVQATYWLV